MLRRQDWTPPLRDLRGKPQTIPFQPVPVRLLADAGTVYGPKGEDLGIAAKGSRWTAVALEWVAMGNSDQQVWVVLQDDHGNQTSVHPVEIATVQQGR